VLLRRQNDGGLRPGYFTGGDVERSLRHPANAPLRLRALIGVEIVHERQLVRYLEVPDHRVTLQQHHRPASDFSPRTVTWRVVLTSVLFLRAAVQPTLDPCAEAFL